MILNSFELYAVFKILAILSLQSDNYTVYVSDRELKPLSKSGYWTEEVERAALCGLIPGSCSLHVKVYLAKIIKHTLLVSLIDCWLVFYCSNEHLLSRQSDQTPFKKPEM